MATKEINDFTEQTSPVATDWLVLQEAAGSTKKMSLSTMTDFFDENLSFQGNPNLAINGNFDIWQRGTNLTYSSGGEFCADRFYDAHSADGGTLPTLIRSRQALTSGDISGSFYFSRLNTNGAGATFGASAYSIYPTKIYQGTRKYCGDSKKITVSFYAKSGISGKKLGLSFYQHYGTGGSPSSGVRINGTNFTLTATWTKYTYTFTTITLAGKTFGTNNNDYCSPELWYAWGSSNQGYVGASTAEDFVGAGDIDIAQFRITSGEYEPPFVPVPFEVELERCQKYFWKTFGYNTAILGSISPAGDDMPMGSTVKNAYALDIPNFIFPVKMLVAPTVTVVNPDTLAKNQVFDGSDIPITPSTDIYATTTGFAIDSASGLFVNPGESCTFYCYADAEI